jgi:hypothetical protein
VNTRYFPSPAIALSGVLVIAISVAIGGGIDFSPTYVSSAVIAVLGIGALSMTSRKTLLCSSAVLATAIPIRLAAQQLFVLPFQVSYAIVALLLLIIVSIQRPRGTAKPWAAFLWALVAASTVALAVGEVKGNIPYEYGRSYVGFIPLLAFPFAAWGIPETIQARAVAKWIIVGTAIYAIFICVLANHNISDWNTVIKDYWRGETRLYFHNSFLLPVIAGVSSSLAVGGRHRAPLWWLVTALMLGASVYSVTRQIIALTALFIIFGCLLGAVSSPIGKRAIRSYVLALVTLLVIGCGYFYLASAETASISQGSFSSRLAARIVNTTNQSTHGAGTQGRLESISLAWHQAEESFPLGDGLGALFANPFATFFPNTRYYDKQPIVDSLLPTLLVKLGLLGVLAFSILFWKMYQIWRRSLRVIRQRDGLIASRDSVLLLAIFTIPAIAFLSIGQTFIGYSEIMIAFALILVAADVASQDELPS